MIRGKKWAAIYVAVLATLVVSPLAYVVFVPSSLDRKAGALLRVLAFRLEERRVERAEAQLARGAVEDAAATLERYLGSRAGVRRQTLAEGSVCRALELLSEIYERQERRGKTLALRRQLVELSPNDFYYAYLLGRALEASGDVDEALAQYLRGFRLEPGHPELRGAYFELLASLSRSAELVEAYEYLRRMERRNPPVLNVRYSSGPSDLERRVLEWMKLPPMAPNLDNADVVLDAGSTALIPLAPVEELLAARKDVLLWGKIDKVAGDLAWVRVETIDATGAATPVAPERLTLTRSRASLQYDYSILLADYAGLPRAVRASFEHTPAPLGPALRQLVARAYRDRAREIPPELQSPPAARPAPAEASS